MRRGLRERNTFVYAGSAVRRRAVADAFDPRYGARTVKRWLEDKIGGSLTDLLATAPPARLRIVRLTEDAGRIAATLEPMQERAAAPGPYVLEGALELATSALEPSVARAAASLERIARSPRLREARERATGEIRYYLDELDQRVIALGELFGVRPVLVPGEGDPEDDVEPLYEKEPPEEYGRGRARRFRTRTGKGAAARPPASRDALIAGVAEALLLERALPQLLDPDAHAVTIVLSRIGSTADASGLSIAAETLAQPSWIDEAATADARGEVASIATSAVANRRVHVRDFAKNISGLMKIGGARDVAVVLRGLFVREALAGDHGTWMIRAAAAEPDVVRVDIRSGAQPAVATLRTHVAARRELERVLEEGGAMPPNPDVLLPVTRTLTYRAPIRSGEPYQIEIEDFSTGWIDRTTARDVPSAIRRAWHLGWSREA